MKSVFCIAIIIFIGFFIAQAQTKKNEAIKIAQGKEMKTVTTKQEKIGILNKPLTDGEAFFWYLGNSGWAVKTKSYLLIFDYINDGNLSPIKELSSGFINPDEIKEQQVVVFVTHEHQDHFSEEIFEWERSVKNITYIFGWNIAKEDKYIKMNPREKKLVNNLEAQTIKSTDLGVGFLIKVDGLTIFHAGDHAKWGADSQVLYEQEINYVAQNAPKIDISFLPIAKGLSCQPTESIVDGAYFAIEKLKSKAVFPMHVRCGDKLNLYKEFAENAEKKSPNAKIYFQRKQGDVFHYRDSAIQKPRIQ